MTNYGILAFASVFSLAACTASTNPPTGPGPGPGPGPNNAIVCGTPDHCVCTGDCAHSCEEGAAECHVQNSGSGDVQITCDENAECHVECSGAASCEVDCGGSLECHVTCPATGCSVTQCTGPGCVVACGTTGEATYSGGTATCD